MNSATKKLPLRQSRLGVRVMFILFAAILLGVLVYIGGTKLGEYAQNTMTYERIFDDTYKHRMVNYLQEYVTANGVSSTDYMEIKIWLSENMGIGFLFDDVDPGESEYVVQFADRAVSILPYATYTEHTEMISLIAAVLGVLAAMSIVVPFARRVSSDIKRLSEHIAIIAGGDFTNEVNLKGHTELAEVAQGIDEMRLAIAEQMRIESEAIAANQELIAALSHDLRTPLTKQLSYLEIAMSGKFDGDEKGMKACIEKAHRAACQLKERTEELFSYFLVFGDDSLNRQVVLEEVDGSVLLGQLMDEQAEFLTDKGFDVEVRPISEKFMLRVYLPGLSRIFDNMTSNIQKYADPAMPVNTYLILNEGRVFVHFENYARADSDKRQGTNMGCRSAARQAEAMGGNLIAEKTGNRYYAILGLPTV